MSAYEQPALTRLRARVEAIEALAFALAAQVDEMKRQQIEERFGWMKVCGGLRKTRYKGQDRVGAWGYFVGATCNLVRMATLALAPPPLPSQ